MDTILKSKHIQRSWDSAAVKKNLRNFRFYPVLIFGILCTLGPAAFVVTVLTRLALGKINGHMAGPAMLLLFGVSGVIFYFGLKVLRFRETGAPGGLAFVVGIIAAAVTFIDRNGETWAEKYVMAPTLWVLVVIFLLAQWWIMDPMKPAKTVDVQPTEQDYTR